MAMPSIRFRIDGRSMDRCSKVTDMIWKRYESNSSESPADRGLAGLLGGLWVHVDTNAAAVDLAGAQMHQLEQLFRQAVLGQFAQRLQRLHGIGNDHDRVIHTGVHHFYSP